jgi:hypothetical protein
MNTPVVFISAATIDLTPWRTHLHTAFSRAGFRVLTQDKSLASAPGNVKRLLIDTIAECDCVIHLAGLGYGSHAQSPFPDKPAFQCSWTQFEYYHSHAVGKNVIAFVCAPTLSTDNFTETGDETERALKAALQLRHRERVLSGEFDGTPLASKVERTCNETIGSVHALLEATAAAVGTLHTIDQEARRQLKIEFESIGASLSRVEKAVSETQSVVRSEVQSAAARAFKHVRWIAALVVIGFMAKVAIDRSTASQTDRQIATASNQALTAVEATKSSVQDARDKLLNRIDETQHFTSSMVAERVFADVAAATGLAPGALRQLTQQADTHGGFIAYQRLLANEGRGVEGRALMQIVAEIELLKPKPDFVLVSDAMFSAGRAALDSGHLADAQLLCARASEATSSILDAAAAQAVRRAHADHVLETSYEVYVEYPAAGSSSKDAFITQCRDIIVQCETLPRTKAKAQLLLSNVLRLSHSPDGIAEAEKLIEAAERTDKGDPDTLAMADTNRAGVRCSRLIAAGKPSASDCSTALAAFETIVARKGISETEVARAHLAQCINTVMLAEQLKDEDSVKLMTEALSSISALATPAQQPTARWLRSRADLGIAEIKLKLAYHERSAEASARLNAMIYAEGPTSGTGGGAILGGSKSSFVMARAAVEDFDRLRKEIDRRHRPASWAIAQRNFARATEISLADEIQKRQLNVKMPFRSFSRQFNLSQQLESDDTLRQKGAQQRLKNREQPALIPRLKDAISACEGAMEVWAKPVNANMFGQISFEQATLVCLLAKITPAEEAVVLYESAIGRFKAIKSELRAENNWDGEYIVDFQAESAQRDLKGLQDEMTHASGQMTELELRMERNVDQFMESLRK